MVGYFDQSLMNSEVGDHKQLKKTSREDMMVLTVEQFSNGR